MIRQTAGVTDQELTERLRSTALYAALRAIAHKQDRPQGYKLTPEEALEFPPQEEISQTSVAPEPTSMAPSRRIPLKLYI